MSLDTRNTHGRPFCRLARRRRPAALKHTGVAIASGGEGSYSHWACIPTNRQAVQPSRTSGLDGEVQFAARSHVAPVRIPVCLPTSEAGPDLRQPSWANHTQRAPSSCSSLTFLRQRSVSFLAVCDAAACELSSAAPTQHRCTCRPAFFAERIDVASNVVRDQCTHCSYHPLLSILETVSGAQPESLVALDHSASRSHGTSNVE